MRTRDRLDKCPIRSRRPRVYFSSNGTVEIHCEGRWRKGARHSLYVWGEKERVIAEWNRIGSVSTGLTADNPQKVGQDE